MPGTYRPGSIKRFITVWITCLLLACVILIGFMLALTAKLKSLTVDAVREAHGSATAFQLQTKILATNRADLQFRETRLDSIRRVQINELYNTKIFISGILPATAETDSEKALVAVIQRVFTEYFDTAVSSNVLPPIEMQATADSLIALVDMYQRMNFQKMDDYIGRNISLREDMQIMLVVLILCLITIALAGSAVLIRRIISPTLALSRVADQFGHGDFTSRVEVVHNDELGNLSRTFNNMADDISRRENDRLSFIASVFHDIRNPLVIIGSSIRMIRKKSMAPEQRDIWLERVSREVDRLEYIAQDLMDIVQVQSGRLSIHKAEMDFAELAAEIFSARKDVLSSHTIEIHSPEECRILGDRRRLERAVINLLSNAVKYSPAGSVITMRLDRTDTHMTFSVTDQGVGISPEDQKILFQPFGRLVRTREMAHGAGMGLFIVKKIIDAHGGTVNVHSTPGVGTTIGFTIPFG
jgi:two-component system, OmpR family, sensor histidine kinase MtrB